jgi:succinoglycan biosynthesis transport protein ExoP
LYEALRTRAEQTQTDPNQQMATGARVVSEAVPPGLPAGPKRKMGMGIGALGGTLMGCFLALVGGRRTQRFHNGEELAPAIGLPVLVKLPDIRRSRPNPEAAEALRLLRSRIRLLGGTAAARTVAFVTAAGRADSAATALAFARMAALDGERVLLIEGSITDPQLASRMGPELAASEKNGLDNLFEKTMPLRDATTTDPVSGMDMLLVEAPSPRLLDFLHGTRFQMLLAEAVQSYGLVVISAPGPNRSETIALAHAADVTVFVVGSGRIRTSTLNSTISGLPTNPYGLAAAVLAG